MKEEIIKRFIGKKVSILLELPKTETSRTNETYNGIIKEVIEGIVILDTNNPSFYLEQVIIDCKLIISMWIYRKV